MQTTWAANGIRIRTFRPTDAPALFDAVRESIPELCPWLPWCHPDYREEEALQFVGTREPAWYKAEEYSFAIIEDTTDRFLGGTGLNRIEPDHKFANLGYWVRTSATRRGVAASAIQLTARFAFRELGLHHLQILAAANNLPSQRAAQKAGARRDAHLRRRLVVGNTVHDGILFSLLPEDLPPPMDAAPPPASAPAPAGPSP